MRKDPPPTRALLDVRALARNFKALSRLSPQSRLLPMVKANAYGHGLPLVSQVVSKLGAVGVGVADLFEARELAKLGFRGEIVCVGTFMRGEIEADLPRKTIVGLYSLETVREACRVSRRRKKLLRAHVQIDSGMHRLGLGPDAWSEAAELLRRCPFLRVEGLFTHLAEADSRDRAFTQRQVHLFTHATLIFEQTLKRRLIRHAANSAGTLFHPKARLDWIRPGIALYGYPPRPPDRKSAPFSPVLEWRARVAQLSSVASGEFVGYNRGFRAPRNMRIATLAVGYGDGYRREYRGVGVGYRGKRLRVAGNVCMDLMMVDVTRVHGIRVGEEMILLGSRKTGAPDARELAECSDTIPYEVLTGIGSRVVRELVKDGLDR